MPSAVTVLQDVIRTMYNPKFIAELFRGQEVYSMHSTRQIFDKLAHSSIMRLNESSMDKARGGLRGLLPPCPSSNPVRPPGYPSPLAFTSKGGCSPLELKGSTSLSARAQLFDLMTMGFKYQLIACKYPQELLHVTLNHLHQLRSKIEEAKAVADLVDEAIRATNERYLNMSPADFAALKQALCRFFEDKHVKVSLFLQDGIQKPDGTIALSCAGPLPPHVDVPGKVVHYDQSGSSIGVDSFAFPGVDDIDPTPVGAALSPMRQAACLLGLNLYSKDKAAAAPPHAADAAAAAAAAAASAAASSVAPSARLDSIAAERAILSSDSLQQSMRDLNLLADLIAPASAPPDSFKLNLFPDTSIASTAGGGGDGGGGGGAPMIMIDVGGKALHASNRNLMGIVDDLRQPVGHGGGGDDSEDLLGLMDSAQD